MTWLNPQKVEQTQSTQDLECCIGFPVSPEVGTAAGKDHRRPQQHLQELPIHLQHHRTHDPVQLGVGREEEKDGVEAPPHHVVVAAAAADHVAGVDDAGVAVVPAVVVAVGGVAAGGSQGRQAGRQEEMHAADGVVGRQAEPRAEGSVGGAAVAAAVDEGPGRRSAARMPQAGSRY